MALPRTAHAPSLVSERAPDDPREPWRRRAGAPEALPSPWSWRIGRIAGVPLRIHATFVILLAWVALSHLLRGQGAAATVGGVLLVLSLFACVVLHELSHALVARHFGIPTRDITLLPIGGVARMERMPEAPRQELLVALAGPAASFAIALSLALAVTLTGGSLGFVDLHVVGGPVLTKLVWVNVALGAFNLLPAFPMDGGRALRAALATRMDRARATALAARIGQGMALLFGAVGLVANPLLVLVAVFVWMGARNEASVAQLRAALSGLPVGRAMLSEFRTLAPGDALGRAVELSLAGFPHAFPVVDGGRVAGVLNHADLVRGLSTGGAEAPVGAFMRRDFETVAPDESLEAALGRLERSAGNALVVVRDGRVAGLLTAENVGELVALRRATRAVHPVGWTTAGTGG